MTPGGRFSGEILHLLAMQQLGPLDMEPISSMNGSLPRLSAAAHVLGVMQPCTGNLVDPLLTVNKKVVFKISVYFTRYIKTAAFGHTMHLA